MIDYGYLYNREYYGELLGGEHCVKRTLGSTSVPGGIALPHRDMDGEICGGLLDSRGEYVDGSGIHRGMGSGYGYSREEVEECGEEVVFLGLWPEVWGHCLTDNLRRLWVLENEEFMNRYGGLRFVYLPMYGMSPGKNFRALLDMAGVGKIRLEPVERITRFRSVILPDECFWREEDGSRRFTEEYRAMIDRIRDHGEACFTKTGDRKLYFTYRKHPALRTIGERRLERFFAGQGYRIVSPEEYSFSEQLNMLLNCEAFASTVGSGSHNSIFLRDGARVHLIPRGGFISEYQPALDQVHELDITYVDASLSLYADPRAPWNGPFYYVISRQLKDCFGCCRGRGGNRLDALIYRDLARAMNGRWEMPGYYEGVMKEYYPLDPRWKPREDLLVRLCRKQRVRRLIGRLFG